MSYAVYLLLSIIGVTAAILVATEVARWRRGKQ